MSAAADILGALVAAKQAEADAAREAQANLAKLARFTEEAIANGHPAELAFMTDRARWIVAMCSRRAGKTFGVAGRFAVRSLAKPGGIRLYLALTGGQAEDIMWEPIWKPMLEKWQISCKHDESRKITTFENGSVCRFRGSDDIRTVKKELGAGLDEAVIDEAQDQPDGVLRDLCIRILSNAMMDRRGTLVVSGVVPEIDAGYFMDLWKLSKWSKHNWSQMDNPHMPHAMEELKEYLEKNPGLTMDSPVIQRERFGKFKYDKNVTAYTYSPTLNGYRPERPEWLDELFEGDIPAYLEAGMAAAKLESLPFAHWTIEPVDGSARFGVMASKPHPGITHFAGAADPGTSDRASVTVIGWGETTEEVQHVFEWSTPRKAGTSLGQIAAWMAVAEHHYPCDEEWRWDPGSGKMEIDTFQRDYDLPVIKAAPKPELAPQIRRCNDLMTKGMDQTMIGSAAEQDYIKSRRDPNTPASGPWKWQAGWHPDPAESKRYATAGYFSEYTPPEPPKPIERRLLEKAQVRQKRALAAKRGHKLDEDVEAAIFEEGESWT